MNMYANEDVMWQRLKDLQREADNRRLLSQQTLPAFSHLAWMLGRRVWMLAGLAMRRPPRRRPLSVVEGEREVADTAA
jgi:hypothetical protein